MAIVFLDGFDGYGPTGMASGSQVANSNPQLTTLLTKEKYTNAVVGSLILITDPLSITGNAIRFSAGTSAANYARKTLSANYSRLIGGIRLRPETYSFTWVPIITFTDGGTAQCSIRIDSATGLISFRRGALNGTAIATAVSAAISLGTTHFLSWDIAFGNSAAYNIYLDGTSIISGTGDTTSTANDYANGFDLGQPFAAQSAAVVLDDLHIFDTSGSFNNSVLTTGPSIISQLPTSDSQKEFTNNGAVLGTTYAATNATNAPGANQLFLRQFIPEIGQTLNSVSCLPNATSATAKFKSVIYADTGSDAPGTLLSEGAEIVGCTSGVPLTSALGASQVLVQGSKYWQGFIADTSVALTQTDGTTLGAKAANTYTSGAPVTAPAMTYNQPSWNIWGNSTGLASNWPSVNDNPPSGDYSGILSSTLDQEDLYNFPSLPASATIVYGMSVTASAKKSDVGTRNISLRTKSAATTSSGSNPDQPLSTSYLGMTSNFDSDPNGSVAWTPATANAAKSGLRVST